MWWEVFRTCIREPQLQCRPVQLSLCSGGHPTTAQQHPTSATSLETTSHRGQKQRGGDSSFPCFPFTVSENQGSLAPEDYGFWPPDLERRREGK